MTKTEQGHHKYFGIKLVVIGILIILNAAYAWFDWATFTGGIFVLVGLVKILMYYPKK